MYTLQPNLKLGRDVWDHVNMPAEEFAGRIERLTAAMRRRKLDALLLYGNLVNDYGNPAYVSNYLLRMSRGAVVILTHSAEATLIFEGIPRGIHMAEQVCAVGDIRAGRNMAAESVKVLQEKKLLPGKIGLVGVRHLMPHDQARQFYADLGADNVVHADDLVRKQRSVKSRREQDQIRRASRIVANAFKVLLEQPVAVMTPKAIEARLIREARMDGAEDIRVAVGIPGMGNWSLAPAEPIALTDGAAVIVLMAVENERYWSETLRTLVVRGNHLEVAPIADLEPLWQQFGKALRPGRKTGEIHQEMVAAMAGLKWVAEYGLGEGVGLGPYEEPTLAAGGAVALKEGMCLSIRLIVEDATLGAVAVGDTVLIGKGGAEPLRG
ncbi:MAG: hypothetical protein A3H32_13330 [Betaproteobacteria bacterium RIFCSPLOWO2_02_FULL_63_19]|nr:MAG: hypothetical protein A3H32_13330 [Betaproteobacteria bacterium RIFCSPLOWO2_02_FULL_63_19]